MNTFIPFKKALLILLGTLLVSVGTVSICWLYWNHIQDRRKQDPQFNIVALAQTSKTGIALKTGYLAELLELSADRPTNLYEFNNQEAMQRLGRCALIKESVVTKFKPGTLFIEYSLREPIAFLGDFSNTAIDQEGILIPFKPFFTPKNLPEIVVGLVAFGEEAKLDDEWGKWGRPLTGPRAKLALELFSFIQLTCCSDTLLLKKIDVSKAFALSYGQRQIIAVFEDRWTQGEALQVGPLYVRLSTAHYAQELHHFLALREELHQHLNPLVTGKKELAGEIIDLRVPQLAFVQTLGAN